MGNYNKVLLPAGNNRTKRFHSGQGLIYPKRKSTHPNERFSEILPTRKHPILYFRNGEIGGTTHSYRTCKAENIEMAFARVIISEEGLNT